MPGSQHERQAEEAPAALSSPPTAAATIPAAGRWLAPASVIRLQRTAGNAAVVRTLQRVRIQDAARKLRAAKRARQPPDARYRLPTGAELKSIYDSGMLDKSVVEDAVHRALKRMDIDSSLRTDADDYFKKLFPSSGTFDEAAFARMIGSDNTMDVYKNAADAETKVKAADVIKLRDIATEADKHMAQAMADDAGLKDVFGTKADIAKQRYDKARSALAEVFKDTDKGLETDYNRDDPQVGLGGWASFKDRHIHLMGDIAEVKDRNRSILTLIHECTHLAHPDVEDHGYYGTPGFEAVPEKTKIDNAAHYEELPARYLKVSKFASVTFTPGTTASGKPMTFEDEVRRAASEYIRTAWAGGVEVHGFVRGVARDMQADPASKSFKKNLSKLLKISKIAKLTIHLQKPKPQQVTTLDLVLMEGAARGVHLMKRGVKTLPVDTTKKKTAAVDQLINDAIAGFGQLTGNAKDDRKLVDFLFKS